MKKLELKTDAHFKKYEKLIFKWANRYERMGLGDIDEMIQEASMVYLKACDTYDSERASFSTHLYVLLRNNMYDMIREIKREPMILSLDEAVDSDGEYTHLDLIASDSFHFDGEIMSLLFKGFTITEIAQYLGVSRPTIYNRLEKERENV